jgi:hypothetical protein|tara:strand:- start:120 stop:701 length:582 start_codon:yes stop_codon:yes gene_type:complete
MKILRLILLSLLFILSGCANRQPQPQPQPILANPYSQGTILREAEDFFGRGAQGVADAFNRVFADNEGSPGAYVKGEEGGASFGIGLRYGHGTLYLSDGSTSPVYWRGPSLGVDIGGSATKVFMLIYNMNTVNDLYQRFGGVEGSLYFIGGVGVNYNSLDSMVVAPVRFGLGWRQGVNIGYLHLSPESSWLPF